MKKIETDFNNNVILKENKVKLKKINKYIENNVIRIYLNEEITKWLGFGGAITESSAYNYFLLDDDKRKQLVNAYYGSEGLKYNLGRIAIASTDFSLSSYEYTKKKDLSDFDLSRDKKYIIPMLDDIYNIRKLSLLASPWTPPKFMKNNKMLILGGKLKKKYYDLYASYLRLFILQYSNLGFNIDYLTMQNEVFAVQKWESCTFTLDEQKDFIYNYLDGKLNDLNTKILLFDHNKEDLYNIYKYLYKDNTNVKGISFHWYSGSHYNNLKLIRKYNKNVLLINSEMCTGFSPYDEKTWLNDAYLYTKEIINNINNGINAFLDWNILLDFRGGPNHKSNYCKCPIILNKDNNNIIKTPIYYYLYHLTRLEENSITIENSVYDSDLYVVSSKKDKNIVITIYNDSDIYKDYNLIIGDYYLNDSINPKSIITYEI